MQVLGTRLYPPSNDNGRIERPIGAKVRELAESRRLTLIRAPAGYGKTALMVDCFRSLRDRALPAIWVSMSGFDGSVAEFITYFNQALARQGISRHGMLDALVAGDTSSLGIPGVCAVFDMIFSELEGPLHVFLDDFDAINGTPAQQMFAALLRETPEKVHWIISCRSHPELPLSRIRVLGELGELHVEDLRFSAEESRQFLMAKGASEALARFVHDRTEGWLAGIQLVSIALERSGGDEAKLISWCSGKQRDIATFFREEIFPQFDENLQQFLLSTCVLGRFTASLCDAMIGRQDARRMIEKLEEDNLFIFSLDEDGQWYRYHDLFAEFMLDIVRDRDPGLESALHLRASRWLSARGLVSEAIAHAIKSGDESYAMQLIDQTWHNLVREGGFVRCGHLISSLGAETLSGFPRVQLWYALYLIVQCRFAEARSLLATLERWIETLGMVGEQDAKQLSGALLNRQLLLAMFCGEITKLERLAQELLDQGDEGDLFSRGSLQLSLIVIRHERYRVRECDELIVSSRDLFTSAGYRSLLVWHACLVGPAQVQHGETHVAVAQYREAIEIARNCSEPGRDSELLSMPLALLADCLLERNECDEARTLFERAEGCASGIGTEDYWVARYVGRGRQAFYEGRATLAEALLNEGHLLAKSRRFERLHWAVTHERIRQAVARADLREAQQVAADAGLPEDEAELRPAPGVTTVSEIMALAWARLAIATGRHTEAMQLLRAWMSFAEPRGALATMLRLALLAGRALHAGGDVRGALRMIRRAFDFAAPGGMIFCFLKEGEPVQSLVAKALDADPLLVMSKPFYARLAGALSVSFGEATDGESRGTGEAVGDASGPVERLTQREIDILRKVAHGMLYKEVADQLGLTEGSVKWYMQQIYGKLGVRRRLRAVEKARTLGYV